MKGFFICQEIFGKIGPDNSAFIKTVVIKLQAIMLVDTGNFAVRVSFLTKNSVSGLRMCRAEFKLRKEFSREKRYFLAKDLIKTQEKFQFELGFIAFNIKYYEDELKQDLTS